MKIKHYVPLYALLAQGLLTATYAETLTVEGDLEVQATSGANGDLSVDGNVAIGGQLSANSLQVGAGSASGNGSVAWGSGNASGYYSTAWGIGNTAIGGNSTAWGYRNDVGYYSTAWGYTNDASGNYSTAWGFDNTTDRPYATAWGYSNTASGSVSTAWGHKNTAIGSISTAWGYGNYAKGNYSTAWGYETKAESYNSTAFGQYNLGFAAVDTYSWDETDPLLEVGMGTSSSPANGLTILKDGRTAIGKHDTMAELRLKKETLQVQGALSVGDYPVGTDTAASSTEIKAGAIRYDGSDFLGYKNATDGWVSLTSIDETVVTVAPNGSLALGASVSASGDQSYAFGYALTASGDRAIALGQQAHAEGFKSFAAQGGTVDVGSAGYGVAIGLSSRSSDAHAIALGWGNRAQEYGSFATGHGSIASGMFSATFGERTKATAYNHFAVGAHNIGLRKDGAIPRVGVVYDRTGDPEDPIFEVGNGDGSDSDGNTVSAASNTLTVFRDGTVLLGQHTAADVKPLAKEVVQVQGPILIQDYATLVNGDPATSTPGAIRFDGDFKGYKNATDGWVSLTSGGSSSGAANKLTTPDESTDVIVVDSSGNTTVSGTMTFTAPMGDIPMFGQVQ